VVEQLQVGFRVNCVALEEGRHAMLMRFEVFGNFQRLDDGSIQPGRWFLVSQA
jgi:hypothetical protein